MVDLQVGLCSTEEFVKAMFGPVFIEPQVGIQVFWDVTL
jgi:hypothetical protein